MPGTKGPGANKAGYCKLCASPDAHVFIRGATEGGKKGSGWNAAEAIEAGKAYGLVFDRHTWYSHLKHAKDGRKALVQAAEGTRQLTIARTTNQEFLETVRDIGMARALANPETISPSDALKAVQIMEGKKEKGGDALAILVSFVTNAPPAVQIIEGTARDVE